MRPRVGGAGVAFERINAVRVIPEAKGSSSNHTCDPPAGPHQPGCRLAARQGLHRRKASGNSRTRAQFQRALPRGFRRRIQVQNDGRLRNGLVDKRKIGQHKKALAQINGRGECLIVSRCRLYRARRAKAAQQRGFPRAIRRADDDLTGRDSGDAPQRVDGPIRFADAQFNFHGPKLK